MLKNFPTFINQNSYQQNDEYLIIETEINGLVRPTLFFFFLLLLNFSFSLFDAWNTPAFTTLLSEILFGCLFIFSIFYANIRYKIKNRQQELTELFRDLFKSSLGKTA